MRFVIFDPRMCPARLRARFCGTPELLITFLDNILEETTNYSSRIFRFTSQI